jgi:hypothetical protein
LVVGPSEEEIWALHDAATCLIGPAAKSLGLVTTLDSIDTDLAWGVKRLQSRELLSRVAGASRSTIGRHQLPPGGPIASRRSRRGRSTRQYRDDGRSPPPGQRWGPMSSPCRSGAALAGRSRRSARPLPEAPPRPSATDEDLGAAQSGWMARPVDAAPRGRARTRVARLIDDCPEARGEVGSLSGERVAHLVVERLERSRSVMHRSSCKRLGRHLDGLVHHIAEDSAMGIADGLEPSARHARSRRRRR